MAEQSEQRTGKPLVTHGPISLGIRCILSRTQRSEKSKRRNELYLVESEVPFDISDPWSVLVAVVLVCVCGSYLDRAR